MSAKSFIVLFLILAVESSKIAVKPATLQAQSPLGLPFNELSSILGGSGKSKQLWTMLRSGDDPLGPESQLSFKVQGLLREKFETGIIPTKISTETVSSCGGRKQLHVLSDGLEVESVLIPHERLPRTTLCVSSQVGCDRGCIFCATGKMGLVRNLNAEEILSQLALAKRTVRLHNLHPLKNIVFMGMGDIGMNLNTVSKAVEAIVDHERFAMASSKVTLSTVGPNPEVFDQLAQMGGTLAWSLHSAVPELRKKLVPSSRYHDPSVLRDALQTALLKHKSPKNRSVMIACTLMHGINCEVHDAEVLVDFLRPLSESGVKVNVDLIPYNDIGFPGISRPTDAEIVAFKEVLWRSGLNHSVRLTRGENEASACGMLATKRKPSSIV